MDISSGKRNGWPGKKGIGWNGLEGEEENANFVEREQSRAMEWGVQEVAKEKGRKRKNVKNNKNKMQGKKKLNIKRGHF